MTKRPLLTSKICGSLQTIYIFKNEMILFKFKVSQLFIQVFVMALIIVSFLI